MEVEHLFWCSLQCVPPPAAGNQGVRGSERAGAVGDLARGLHPPPRRSPLLSFGTVADCLPARLLLSSPLLSPALRSAPLEPTSSFLRFRLPARRWRRRGEEEGRGHSQRLSRFPRNRDLADRALHSTCILQRGVQPPSPLPPVSFPTSHR